MPYGRFPFRVAYKSLLITGRPCLVGGGYRPGPVPGDLLPPLLLTKLVSPLPISWPVSLTIESSSDWPVFPLQPPLYICIRLRAPRLLRPCESPYTCVRLRALRLLRPFCELPGWMLWGRWSWPVFPLPRALPMFPPCWAVWLPSRCCCVAVASLSRCCLLGRVYHAY